MQSLPPLKPEVATPTPECPNPGLWKCYDGMATEVEVLEFLYSLVRMLKPSTVIETGTYLGYGTLHLARAVRDNGFGHVYSAEPDLHRLVSAGRLLEDHLLDQYVTLHQLTGVGMINVLNPIFDFAFLDSNLDTRIGEMRALLPRLAQGGVVAVHDTNTYHAQNGGPRQPFLQLAQDKGLQQINFDTPRGLMLLRKQP